MHTKSELLSVKVDRGELRLLEVIAKEEEEQSDRSTMASRLLDAGARGWKIDNAVEMFRSGRLSLWWASVSAGLSLREFTDVLNARKVAPGRGRASGRLVARSGNRAPAPPLRVPCHRGRGREQATLPSDGPDGREGGPRDDDAEEHPFREACRPEGERLVKDEHGRGHCERGERSP